MAISRWALIFVVVALVPFASLAQTASSTGAASTRDAALKEAIRADIQKDPRSSQMSQAEIDAMVDALAAQAEEQGVDQQYMDAQNSFQETPAPVYQPEPFSLTPLGVSVLALLAAIIAAFFFLRRHRHNLPPMA